MATTHQNDLRALEMTRQRLISLTNAISSLQRELMTSDPLPSWPSLTTSFTLLSHQLASLTTHLSTNATTLSSLHTYPLPIPAPATAPADPRPPIWHAQEAMLTQLLRKKLDPDAESWVQAGLERATDSHVATADASHDFGRDDGVSGGERQREREQLWSDAPARARELAAKMPWGANFTIAERKGEGGVKAVETGLKRDLAADESDDEDDEDDDDEDEDDDEDGEDDEDEKMDLDDTKTGTGDATQATVPKGPMLPLEDVLRFMSTGVLVPRRPGGAPGPGSGPRPGGIMAR